MKKHCFPGLQSKFLNLLKTAFTSGEHFSGLAIPPKVRELGPSFQMSDEEIEFICRGTGNFLTAAKKAGVIRGLGPHRGYLLASPGTPSQDRDGFISQSSSEWASRSASLAAQESSTSTHEARADASPGAISIFSESFLHFPATLLLADYFQGQVVSLPAKMDGKKWANPDMIMIHDNRLAREEDSDSDDSGFTWDEQLALLAKVDNSPQYVITSVELKLGLRNRTDVLNALSETALNGGWANQSILLYLDKEGDSGNLFDEDALNFARNNGIGIYAIEVISLEETKSEQLRLNCILPSRNRAYLEIKSLSANRALFKRVLDLIKDYSDEGPLLGQVDSTDYYTLARILIQAMNNLEIQRDFTGRKDLCERLAAVKATNPEENTIIHAIGQYLPTMLGDVQIMQPDFEAELEELPAKDSNRVRNIYAILTQSI